MKNSLNVYLIGLLFILMCGCTTVVKKHTYLKYSGYMEGCANGLIIGAMSADRDLRYAEINQVWVDTTCMEVYLQKLEAYDIEPPEGLDKHLDRNEML